LYTSIYHYAKKHVVATKWVNWEWMASRRHTIFDKTKATCDELEMIKMMSFKYNCNDEIICQFYSNLYIDVDGQRLMWMTDSQVYEITVRRFAHLLGLDLEFTLSMFSSQKRCTLCMLQVQLLIHQRLRISYQSSTLFIASSVPP
jgi:hypothetical protein